MNGKRWRAGALALCTALLLWPAARAETAAPRYAATVQYLCRADGAQSVQQWLDGALTQHPADGSEWCAFALRQQGQYDFSTYAAALREAAEADTVAGAVTRQKYALLLTAFGDTAAVPAGSIGGQGVMSLIYGLHLLRNGCAAEQTWDEVCALLLAQQKEDGGWAVFGAAGDADVTAMAVQALAYGAAQEAVDDAIRRALAFLSAAQQPDGTFMGYGVSNCESTAQVVLVLTALGHDPAREPAFRKQRDLLTALESFATSEGGFAHLAGGEVSPSACAQALLALTAAERFYAGEAADLYDLSYRPAQTAPTIAPEPAGNGPSMRIWLSIGTVLLLGSALLYLRLRKKGGKHLISAVLVGGAVLAAIWLIDLRGAHTATPQPPVQAAVGTVTFAVRCDTVAGMAQDGTTPADGVLLPATELTLYDGDTVYDLLQRCAADSGLRIDHTGSRMSAYIAGINDLRQGAFGDLSGWLFYVNGVSPSVGCGQFRPQDGDRIEWLYSRSMGQDIAKEEAA